MERIESLEAFQFSKPPEKKKTKRGKALNPPRFASVLESAGAEGGQSEVMDAPGRNLPLEELLDEVHGSGEALVEAPTLENIKSYRQAVRSFLDYVVGSMLEVRETTSGTNVLKRKRFTQIRIIDEKLERLVTGILQDQHRQIELLARINEIKGLLVDLMS